MTDYQYPGEELDLFAHANNWKSYFASLLRPYIGGDVLEVGAGIGATTRTLFNESVDSWVALEPDAELAARFRIATSDMRPIPECIDGTLDGLDASLRFDTILYIDVLEHIADDKSELRNAAKHLSPGGALIVLSPAFPSLYSEFDRALGHERRYTARSLASVFPDGLSQAALFYADSLGALLSLGNRFGTRQEKPKASQIQLWDRVVIPISRFIDPIIGRSAGRSVIAVYRRPAVAAAHAVSLGGSQV